MELRFIHNIYFIGIGGIGMSALARYFKSQGKNVAGYDKTPTKLTAELQAEGIDVHFEDDMKMVDEKFKTEGELNRHIMVVYTPAIPKDHRELNFFRDNNFNLKKRSEVLGDITKNSKTIAVAGTHGKTTTSSIVAHILKSAGTDMAAFLGGITQNYNTNLILSKKNEVLVAEADEYDRSFLTLFPDIAVITSLDADHLDIYGDKHYMQQSYELFSDQVKSGGVLILKKGLDLKTRTAKIIYYSLKDQKADYCAENIRIEEGHYVYDVKTQKGIISGVHFGLPGLHNVENSIAAIAVATVMNISADNIKTALSSFKGVKRRFEYHIRSKDLVYIDDYAHHPEELRACITSVKELYPGKKITGIFQPHLYTRTRDFADEFAASLSLLDELILLEIYPAREKPIDGVSSNMLLEKVTIKQKKICQKSELIDELRRRPLQILLTLGAGDIDVFTEPIRELLNEKVK